VLQKQQVQRFGTARIQPLSVRLPDCQSSGGRLTGSALRRQTKTLNPLTFDVSGSATLSFAREG
jgi:hypothetical protein